MKYSLLLFLFFVFFSCSETNLEQVELEEPEQSEESEEPGESGEEDVVTDVYGVQYPTLDPSIIYCGPGWGTKMCHFLHKYDGTIWADADNYYSDFSDIKFSNLYDPVFISFFNIDSIASYCKGWNVGETTYDGIKWVINIKKDQEDVFWFDLNYFGSNEEVEYTVTHKYEVINGLLNYSNSDGQTFVFYPSEKDYSKEFIETNEIVELEGCSFY